MARQRRPGGWLSSLLGGGPDDPPGTTYELHVLEGADSGAVFPLSESQIQIGRQIPGETDNGGIGLTDRSVSSRHALISCEDGEVTVEHLPSATNPTLVNGRRIKRKRVRDGDRVVLGLVVMELRAKHPAFETPAPGRVAPPQVSTDPVNIYGELVLREGLDDLEGARFPLTRQRTSIGRDEDCDIVLEVSSISREHAVLVWEDDQLVLVHESAVNPTHVNGMLIRDRRRVFHGDEIRIAERVSFSVLLEAEDPPTPLPEPTGESLGDAEATRLTSPPEVQAPQSPQTPEDLEEPTRIFELEPPPGPEPEPQPEPEPAPTVVEAPTPEPEAAPTVIEAQTPEREPPEPLTGDEARIAAAPSSPGYSDGAATRIAPAPDLPGNALGDATRIAPAPEAPEADATRIAPVQEPVEEPAKADEAEADDKTLIRPSPVPDVSAGERTRVVDLDSVLGAARSSDADKTLIRPRHGSPTDADDPAATLVRPRPEPPGPAPESKPPKGREARPAETVIIPPDEDDEESANSD